MPASVPTWRPSAPDRIVKVLRGDDEAWVGIITDAMPTGDKLHVSCSSPAVLLKDMPLPFNPPAIRLASDPAGFNHWWRQMVYVFDLPDPLSFPPILASWADADRLVLDRFVSVTHGLAASGVVSSGASVQVQPPVDGMPEAVTVDFPPMDLQAGFSTLLRQCHESKHDPARYDCVRRILVAASKDLSDPERSDRLATLEVWNRARKRLLHRSLEGLMCDAFVEREGWAAFQRTEECTPKDLLRIFNYGDLIHWASARDDVVPPEDAYSAAHQRFAFLQAAVGLAHFYIGFGELVRAAVTPGIVVPT